MKTITFKDDLDHYHKLASFDPDAPDDTGRFKAVFPMGVQGTQKEEDYITRMIRKDRELNLEY